MSYIIIERSLLRSGRQFGLTIDAIYLYATLRDRASLSARNGYIDADGQVYVYCSRAGAAELVGCSERKAGNLLAMLRDAGLIAVDDERRIRLRQWTEPSIIHPVEELRNGGFWPVTKDNYRSLPEDYITVDTEVMRSGMSTRAKVLYALLHDASDGQALYGCDSCAIPMRLAMELLACGHDTLARVYRELERIGLITRGPRRGFGGSRGVSVADSGPIFASQSSDNRHTVVRYATSQSSDNCTQSNRTYPSVQNHPLSANLLRGCAEAPQKEMMCVELSNDLVALGCTSADAQVVAEAVCAQYDDDMSSNAKAYRIGQQTVARDSLAAAYKAIDRYTLATIGLKLVAQWERIKDHRRYIRAALYHADKHTAEAYFTKLAISG